MKAFVTYLGRDLDIGYDIIPSEENVGITGGYDIYQVWLDDRPIIRLLSHDTLNELTELLYIQD